LEERTLLTTQDGSHTIKSEQFDATYHSIFGAVDESIHVFIMAGLDYLRLQSPQKTQINVLEIGMGTGLNVWLAALWANTHHIQIDLVTIEKYPVRKEQYTMLNFADSIPSISTEQAELIQTIHSAEWGQKTPLTDYFSFTKYEEDVLEHQYPTDHNDVIFFDAFAPNAQPELWEPGFHSRLLDSLVKGGILTTYCAKGVFKRMLKSIGYELDQLPGPHRKHEMTRAIKLS
jgi:tRNA U34 5-methylaminomethyl-2-thiouridine-forming methyltransferase MnmC